MNQPAISVFEDRVLFIMPEKQFGLSLEEAKGMEVHLAKAIKAAHAFRRNQKLDFASKEGE